MKQSDFLSDFNPSPFWFGPFCEILFEMPINLFRFIEQYNELNFCFIGLNWLLRVCMNAGFMMVDTF